MLSIVLVRVVVTVESPCGAVVAQLDAEVTPDSARSPRVVRVDLDHYPSDGGRSRPYMLSILIASTVAAAPDWTLLAFPRATRSFETAPVEPVLLDATHLDIAGGFRPSAVEAPEPPIPSAIFQQMLDESLRQRGLKLETRPQGGLLLARGDAAALDAARALIADLDRQTAALEIDLEITLQRTGSPETKWRRRAIAGTELFFGARTSRPFVSGFNVQVAQDAGQAEPQIGAAYAGTGLHLRATRIAGGARVFLDGVYDSARIASVDDFDPETPDAGVFQQPRVESAQIAFAGAIESGAALEVRLAGASGDAGETVLSIRATARPDAAPANDGWVMLDLAFSSLAPRPLMPVDPGLALVGDGLDAEPGSALLTPAVLATLLETDRASSGRAILLWTRTLLAIPRGDTARIESARALVRAAEETRAASQRANVACGPLRATFPVSNGRLARLVVGTERPYLTDYGLEVAPQIWMPSPRVERAFDGISAEITLSGGTFALDAWRASTPESLVVDRLHAQMGGLQLPSRARVAGTARTAAGEPPATVFDEGAPLTLSAGTP